MTRCIPCITLLFVLLCISPALAGGPVCVSATGGVNPVIGDISFLVRFGRMPTAADGEGRRIGTHLAYVEALLRARDVSHLSPGLRAARARNLDLLHEYRIRGAFPLNERYPVRRTCFIDDHGTICAVGYLVEHTAGRDAAEEINASFQHATIAEMRSPVLDTWLRASGLTRTEAAMIQPAYGGGPLGGHPVILAYDASDLGRFGLKGRVAAMVLRSPEMIERAQFGSTGLLLFYGKFAVDMSEYDSLRHAPAEVVRGGLRVMIANAVLSADDGSVVDVEIRTYATNPLNVRVTMPRVQKYWKNEGLHSVGYGKRYGDVLEMDSTVYYSYDELGRLAGERMVDEDSVQRRMLQYAYDTAAVPAVPLAELLLTGRMPGMSADREGATAFRATADDTLFRRLTVRGSDTVAWDLWDAGGRHILSIVQSSATAASGIGRRYNEQGDLWKQCTVTGASIVDLVYSNGRSVPAETVAYRYTYDRRGNWTRRERSQKSLMKHGADKHEVMTREIAYY